MSLGHSSSFSLPGFDAAAAIARMLDEPALWWQALGMYVDHFSDWEAQWRSSIGDVGLERKRVHALRSASANIGAEDLAEVAGQLEAFLLVQPTLGHTVAVDDLRERVLGTFQATLSVATNALQAYGEGGQGT